ncbi:hypothetical protein B0H63DRAFT_524170 [Podospora didyma]|uniref:adenosine deaminase n=1 Tax=Podospora didyma TaxID=330526 RepID=A0AAE0NHA9_9PEZI|nr:hypothetical protein B0H63DRAFT_524170 [Podospora didyma]
MADISHDQSTYRPREPVPKKKISPDPRERDDAPSKGVPKNTQKTVNKPSQPPEQRRVVTNKGPSKSSFDVSASANGSAASPPGDDRTSRHGKKAQSDAPRNPSVQSASSEQNVARSQSHSPAPTSSARSASLSQPKPKFRKPISVRDRKRRIDKTKPRRTLTHYVKSRYNFFSKQRVQAEELEPSLKSLPHKDEKLLTMANETRRLFAEEIDPLTKELAETRDPKQREQLNKKLADAIGTSILMYEAKRHAVLQYEDVMGFEYACQKDAEDGKTKEVASLEVLANEILMKAKVLDRTEIYGKANPRQGVAGQMHPRFPGDRFITNGDLIPQTRLYAICRKMPKGAHLHIHFNSNLLPNVLLDIAREQTKNMYIMSTIPLTEKNKYAFDRCEIQFSIVAKKDVADKMGDIFKDTYQPLQYMSYSRFRQRFPRKLAGLDVDEWLQKKLVFQEAETYSTLQTAAGAWEIFNARTRMMKGLFNYRSAYLEYIQACLQEFADDNIQYAEIRPNFMVTNQVMSDDGTTKINNWEIMELIINGYNEFQKGITKKDKVYQEGHGKKTLMGLKVIYCTPRSFDPEMVRESLEECLAFKKDPKFAPFIAGFDLVGEESMGKPLRAFAPVLLEFKAKCAKEGVDIPFLFHCGETTENGTSTDENLVDALVLEAKRIGHGFALAKHPHIMQAMKAQNICLEICPISNEILGLTPRVAGHTMYALLANDVHCTVSTDNGTLFRSRLSHDFYQAMVGKEDMTIHGWRQLIEWSILHSCMDKEEQEKVFEKWEEKWATEFCQWIYDYRFTLLNPEFDVKDLDKTAMTEIAYDKKLEEIEAAKAAKRKEEEELAKKKKKEARAKAEEEARLRGEVLPEEKEKKDPEIVKKEAKEQRRRDEEARKADYEAQRAARVEKHRAERIRQIIKRKKKLAAAANPQKKKGDGAAKDRSGAEHDNRPSSSSSASTSASSTTTTSTTSNISGKTTGSHSGNSEKNKLNKDPSGGGASSGGTKTTPAAATGRTTRSGGASVPATTTKKLKKVNTAASGSVPNE